MKKVQSSDFDQGAKFAGWELVREGRFAHKKELVIDFVMEQVSYKRQPLYNELPSTQLLIAICKEKGITL